MFKNSLTSLTLLDRTRAVHLDSRILLYSDSKPLNPLTVAALITLNKDGYANSPSLFLYSLTPTFFSSPPVPPCCGLLLLQFTLITVGAVNPFAVFSLEKEGETERKE